MNAFTLFRIWTKTTQITFVLLIGLLILWCELWFPPETINAHVLTLIWILPLIFPTWGVLKAKLYTFAWLQFINMIYFCHAIMYMMSSEQEFWIASIELILVLTNFCGAIISIRLNKKHQLGKQ